MSFKLALLSIAISAATFSAAICVVHAEPAVPAFSDTGPDAEEYGWKQGYPVPPVGGPTPDQNYMVGLFSHFDRVTPMREVSRGNAIFPLKRASEEIAPVYNYADRQKRIDEYLYEHPATGLLIAREDTILYEHYQYARTDQDRFVSNSMVKTITGLLVGIAISEGAIRSVDDTAATYVPELSGTEYGGTPLRALLQMSSGIAFHETYEPGGDIAKFHGAVLRNKPVGAIAALKMFNSRDAAPGTRFAYASAEAEVLGLVVARAVKVTLADYFSTRIWQKLGAESDAAWAIDPTGQETGYCCFVAILRDWARLGLMLANDGAWNGQQIVPRQWLIDSTTVSPKNRYLQNTIAQSWGYGYQVWILPGERRMFVLLGSNGQDLFVDPESKLVMVQTAVRKLAGFNPKSPEVVALWYALVAQYGHRR